MLELNGDKMFQKNMQEYWVQKPKMVGETDFLAQVGKTVNRQPISDEQFRTIVSDIIAHLDLKKQMLYSIFAAAMD